MIEIAIRCVALILAVGAGLHLWGSLQAFRPNTPERAWSLGAGGFALLLSAIGWVGAGRHDMALTTLIIIGCIGWIATVVAFGRSIANVADPRVLYHILAAAALAILSLL